MSRTHRLLAHRPGGRVVHAARLSEDGREAITACGRSLGTDYSVVDEPEAQADCRSCRRTGQAL